MSETVTLGSIIKNNERYHGIHCAKVMNLRKHNAEISIIYNGYEREQSRMADISKRCGHHLSQFRDPLRYVTFIIKLLNRPIKRSRKHIFALTETQYDEYSHIIDLVGNGICKGCAHILANRLIVFAAEFHSYHIYDPYANKTLSCVMTALLQHQSVSIYYFKNISINSCIIESFLKLCDTELELRKENPVKVEDNILSIYSSMMLFSNQILRNSYLLKQSKYWTMIAIPSMDWILKELQYQINGINYPRQTNALWNVTWIISLSFYYHKKRNNVKAIKKEINLIKWRKQLFSILLNHRNNYFVSKLCIKLLKASNERFHKKPKIKAVVKRVWQIKAKNMECVYLKCTKKAKNIKNGKLYICSRCCVARYCSKSCQKKHWTLGQHRKVCRKLAISN